ncbi:MAG: hypothetical protein ACJAUP_002630 [Cellvibrionaceae bacterium]|jgi:hypothetical protein
MLRDKSVSSYPDSQSLQRTLASTRAQYNPGVEEKNNLAQAAVSSIAENLGKEISLIKALPKTALPFGTKHDYKEETNHATSSQDLDLGRIFSKINGLGTEYSTKQKVVGYFDLSSASSSTINQGEHQLTDLKGTITLKDCQQKINIYEAGYGNNHTLIIPKKSELENISHAGELEVELKRIDGGWILKQAPKTPKQESEDVSQDKSFVLANNSQLAESVYNKGAVLFCGKESCEPKKIIKYEGTTKVQIEDFSGSDSVFKSMNEPQSDFKKIKYSEEISLGKIIGSGFQADVYRIDSRKDTSGKENKEVMKKSHQRSCFNSSDGMIRRDVAKQKRALGPKAINYRYERYNGQKLVVLPEYDRTLGRGVELDIMSTGSKSLRNSYIKQMNEIYQSIKKLERPGSLTTVSDIKPENFLVKFSIGDDGKPAVKVVAADLKTIGRHLTNAAKKANLGLSKEDKKDFKEATGVPLWRAGMSAAFLYKFGNHSSIMDISKEGFKAKPLGSFESEDSNR